MGSACEHRTGVSIPLVYVRVHEGRVSQSPDRSAVVPPGHGLCPQAPGRAGHVSWSKGAPSARLHPGNSKRSRHLSFPPGPLTAPCPGAGRSVLPRLNDAFRAVRVALTSSRGFPIGTWRYSDMLVSTQNNQLLML